MVICWDSGAYSVIQSGWWQPKAPGPEAGTRLWGKKGYASLFPTVVEVNELGGGDSVVPEGLPAKSEHCDQLIYDGQYREFSRRVGEQPITQPVNEPGLVAVMIVEAAYESARTGGVVTCSL